MNSEQLDFTMEFTNKVSNMAEELQLKLYDEAYDRLSRLRGDHNDLTGAAVRLEELVPGRDPRLFEARVVVYIRPENIAATEKDDVPLAALKSALTAVERQVREKRKRLREHYKQP